MGKYDKILTIGLLILETFYFVLIKRLPENAAKYPMFVCILLIVLTIMLGIRSFTSKEKYRGKLFADLQLKQFLFIIIISAIYIFLIELLGFFVTTFIYLMVAMIGLKANIKLSAITSIAFCILIYLVFVAFLKVPVPSGFLI
ncbi:tripartite tricarboxylate transporter TctB family protein [Fusobacterium sp.]|uniref:tripartite tricarboxylate transporter TctB family protein n=1 Tax=Fusobacterium sp. TaxID=68766 RepID=UPI0028FDEF67|nr:tripartite tricarboxylate transporter TctB family protein [Fusobacterium sp.]MDU1909696.1 tripartite tricarboxylate transporter TctB family protein [Fusobacterium sp.]